ncbi:MAG: deoxyhypusine synthase family protein [Candidatus Hydrogenedentes bacterium]|nr:deoxyhypusine synthase family protein [Candidatus Hydrogenedentota bacterium]
MKKDKYTETPTRPFEISGDASVSSVLERMKGISFQGRSLARAYDIWCQALKDECTILFGLAGAMVPAGMRKIIVHLIQNRLIDCVVTTGANMFHDCHETLGYYHFQGSADVDDAELNKLKIDRIYDTLSKDEEFDKTDEYIAEFAAELEARPYTTREFLHLLGKKMSDLPEQGILTAAYEANVPIYCPAIADSSIGIALAALMKPEDHRVTFDLVPELAEMAQIALKSPGTAAVLVSGGTPKNYIQQLQITASFIEPDREIEGHRYAIQFTTDSPQWGGLGGCTFEEGQSWGKISRSGQRVVCFCDATIALPIVVSALAERSDELRRKKVPRFELGSDFKITV